MMAETEPEAVPYLHCDRDSSHEAVVTELQEFDVLCCEKINNPKYEGNKKFAALLAMNCQEYVAAKAVSERKKIVGSVVNSFILHSRAPGGRFLKSTNKGFVVISRRDAVEWVYKDLQQVLHNPPLPLPPKQPTPTNRNNKIRTQKVIKKKRKEHQPEPTMEDNLVSMRNHEIEIEASVQKVLAEQKKIIMEMSAKGKFELDITKKISPGILPWASLAADSDDNSRAAVVSETMTEKECEMVRTETAQSEQEKIDRRVAKILLKQKSILAEMSGKGKFKEETIELIKSEMSSISEIPT